MWRHSPEPLQALDLDAPCRSSRTRLFALPPAGLGTDRVEDLASYLIRLARAHSVSPRILIREEFRGAAEDPGQLRNAARHPHCAGTLIGHGKFAELFVALTTELTSIADVRYLTLLPLAGLLPRNGAAQVATSPRWCPLCLADMIVAGTEVARPLAWSLSLYRICHRHQRPLSDRCPACGKRQRFLPSYPDLACCDYCGTCLAENKLSPPAHPVADMELWVAEAISDLLARLPSLGQVATHARFIRFLNAMVRERADGNQAAFCRQLNLPPWTIKQWIARGERPSLSQILAIGYGLSLRPAEMLLSGEQSRSEEARPVPAKVHTRAERPRLTPGERSQMATKLAKGAADPTDARSLAQWAQDLALKPSCLKYWFPEECAAIRAKRVQAKAAAATERRKRDAAKIAAIVDDLTAGGVYPGRRKVNELLRPHVISLAHPDRLETYRMAVSQALSRSTPAGSAKKSNSRSNQRRLEHEPRT